MSNTFKSYVFGYGGLILAESRELTFRVKINSTPAVLNGFERIWGHKVQEYNLTSLSLRKNPSRNCIGVIFPVTVNQLDLLDARETGYKRVKIPKDQIHLAPPLSFEMHHDLPIFTYITNNVSIPTEKYPIIQSELDAILTGCLREYGEKFALGVLNTTWGWNKNRHNDRKNPRYPWAKNEKSIHEHIDRLLSKAKLFEN